jgi:DNA polymerase-1
MKIAFDTETRGFKWFDGETAFLGSWSDAKNDYVANLLTADGKQEYDNALKAADPLVAHNFSFDCHQTLHTTGYDILGAGTNIDDTDIMARVAIPTGQNKGSYKLKDLAGTLLNDPDAAKEQDIIKELGESIGVKLTGKNATPEGFYLVWKAYPDEMEKYAKKDSRHTYDLHTKLETALGDSASYELEREVIPVLTQAEETGVRLDQEVVQRLKGEYEALEAEHRAPLVETIGEDALGGKGSKQALLDALLEMGVPLYRTTKDGSLATHKFALQEFTDEFPILQTLLDWRVYEKFLSTYIAPMDGREVVHTSFKQAEAWTGRMSSASPNMQNIPKRAGKGVRAMFIPREDHVFVVYDYESIEVRLLAYYMASESYRSLIREGLDPHAYMAAQIHGGDMEMYTKENATPENRKKRDVAKNTMFAITYGAGARRVSDMNQISKAEAKALITKIKKGLPGYYRLNQRIKNKIKTQGYVNTAFGRKQVVAKDKSYVGLNSLIQGTAAEVMKKGLVQVNDAVQEYGATPLLVVHDEVVVECPRENAERVSALMGPALTSAFPACDPPLAVEGGIVTTNYADA